MATLSELQRELDGKRANMKRFIEEHPIESMTADDAAELRRLNQEVTEASEKRDRQAEIEAIVKGAGFEERPIVSEPTFEKPQQPKRLKGVADVVAESEAYKRLKATGRGTAVFEFGDDSLLGMSIAGDSEQKTLLTLADISPMNQRLPGIVPFAREQRTVADMMLSGRTNATTIEYYEMTTYTNAAAETDEGAEKPEAAVDFTLRTEPVRKIAVWLPVTTEALQDNAFLESLIRETLVAMVREREEQQLLVGDGTAPNISGITDRNGIQTQAKGTDPVPDAVYKAMTKVRNTGFAEPTGVEFHPNDWQDVRLLRTADGIYIWGSPADAGPERIWGLEVRVTTNMTENTALVGAFRPYAQVFRRSGITVTASTEHSTYFVENKVALLAEERLALAVYRPAAFATVTGI